MKLEQYTKAQSGQGIRELTHEFFEYHQNYIQKVGNTLQNGLYPKRRTQKIQEM